MNIKLISGVVIAGLAASYAGGKFYMTDKVEKQLDAKIIEMKPMIDVKYGDLSVEPITQKIQLHNVVLSPVDGSASPVTINEITINKFDVESEFPAALDIALNGISISIDDIEPQTAEQLKELGYTDDMLISLSTKYTYVNDVMDLELGLSAQDMGKMEYSLNLADFQFDPKQPISLLFSYPNYQLNTATFTYTDQSFIQRLLKQEAQTSDISVEELKQRVSDKVNNLLAADLENKNNELSDAEIKLAKNAAATFVKFINDPKSITISVNPEQAVTLGEITQTQNDPAKLIALLNMAFKA
ncbi:hypothetical protein [Moritella viscosa]|uniref:Uncharacterized protein n=1 Tax=Moritella viscosa TaxID=80854 RepID=A0A1L0AJJ6_9GAMM|nr:hypothetical protein [Moritella viscosa]SGZ16362.1 Putative uncharacterized protein [Moritella viscosa]SHO07378.1 Putative uncharacterized protein [Moritella viscosa]SHO14827.1 Putative uncharacterized protein [Moritella viscosa]SHO15213.1 Putative uncharacterized protein [Moritella viscosa]SHO17694.1 Putative uncharacterized protein [Moritella viscosa]